MTIILHNMDDIIMFWLWMRVELTIPLGTHPAGLGTRTYSETIKKVYFLIFLKNLFFTVQ